MRIKVIPFVLLALACKKEVQTMVYQAIPVERRSITVSVRATGTVQPDTLVEVKSKASGEILEIKVETGQVVHSGDLLVRVDQRTARNGVSQSEAQLEVARARLANAETQKKRSDELFKSQSITEQELETAALAVANAKAEVVNGQVAVENARIRMEDTDVIAPISGTIITKTVERGQVISSPTSDVGGGTVLLKMADLELVQVRTLVDETDIGKIKPGLRSTVTVDAYPNQPFQGEVLKIEPQAETAQNVTMFPVLIRIENRGGLLKPGMNADVQIHVGERDSVLAVPNAALRTPRDINSARQVLGIDSLRFDELMKLADTRRDSIQKSRMAAARPDSGRTGAQLATNTGAASAPKQGKDSSAAKGETMSLPDGRTVTLPPGITAAQVRALFQKRFSGGTLTPAEQATMQQLMRAFGGGRGGAGGRRPSGADYQFGGNYIVIVERHGEIIPVHVRTGLTDLDYSEVVWGLEPTDSVVILPSASLVQSQEEFKQRMSRFTNQGVPGMRQDQQAAPTTQAKPQTPGSHMIVGEIIKVAFQSIRANKLRAALTMLGVIIGVAAVITVVALSTGAQKAVEAKIQALGANLLSIYPGQSFFGGRASDQRVSLTTDDADALDKDATTLSGVVPEMQRNLQVELNGQNANLSIVGTTANYTVVRNYKIPQGRMFTSGDDGARQRYAVLGAQVPAIFNQNPKSMIGRTLQIRGLPFEVIGILEPKGSLNAFMNPDEQILIPLKTARYRIFGTDRLRSISVAVKEGTPLEQGMVDIERIMRREHKVRPGGENDFQIRNQAEILATQQQTTQTFGVLLASIAIVSLIVGGIGIMNIMLVSVTERTREIGIRKALGATRSNIMFQFLIEALVLCMAGGILGVALGFGASTLMSTKFGWNTLVSPTAVGVAFAFSAAVGLIFGLWPARRAATLNTIDALRYE